MSAVDPAELLAAIEHAAAQMADMETRLAALEGVHHHLERFVKAQEPVYDQVVEELTWGKAAGVEFIPERGRAGGEAEEVRCDRG